MGSKKRRMSDRARDIYHEESRKTARKCAQSAHLNKHVRDKGTGKLKKHKDTERAKYVARTPKRHRAKAVPEPTRITERQKAPMLHVLHANGKVESVPWTGRLENKHPPYEDMYPLIESDAIEHVKVLYKGKRAHLFVDEEGGRRGPTVMMNWRASALYANWRLYRNGATHFLYQDINKEPELSPATLIKNEIVVVGTAVLWEGEVA